MSASQLPAEYTEWLEGRLSRMEHITDAFSATGERLDYVVMLLTRILTALGGMVPIGEQPIIRSDRFLVQPLTCIVADTPYEAFRGISVPSNLPFVIKASPENAFGSYIYVGPSNASITTDNAWPLMPNEAIGITLRSLEEKIYISSNVAGSKAYLMAEQ